jgi:hypothetical protein
LAASQEGLSSMSDDDEQDVITEKEHLGSHINA